MKLLMVRTPIHLLVALALAASPATALAQESDGDQRANRERCTNGALLGGVAGALIPHKGWRNRVGGAALGATAGCVINRGVNEGK
jgi:peptidoglycan/LPS O-acetylase OafA/YrhL